MIDVLIVGGYFVALVSILVVFGLTVAYQFGAVAPAWIGWVFVGIAVSAATVGMAAKLWSERSR